MQITDTVTNLRTYPVLERTVRWFHWLNVLSVLGLMGVGLVILYGNELGIKGEGKVLLKTVHVWIGYVFALNLGWRLVWAFIGGRHSRWRAILPGRGFITDMKSWLAGMRAGTPPTYLGHNPPGRLMISLLLLMLLTMAVSGLVLAGTDIFYPPFGAWIAQWVAAAGVDPAQLVPGDKSLVDAAAWEAMRAFRKPFISVHETLFYVLGIAVVIHVAAVVVAELREGGSLISAMFSGRKTLDRAPVDAGDAD